jgi:hypothetical protein
VGIARALPRHQHSALPQQRRGVLGQQRKRPDGACRHCVVRPLAPTERSRNVAELLRARGYGARVGHLARLDQPVHHGCLSAGGLHEVNLCLRQSHRQDESRKACTRTDIGYAPCGDELRDRKPTQCIRNVNLDRCFRVSGSGMRVRLGGQRLENALDLARSGPPKAVASG